MADYRHTCRYFIMFMEALSSTKHASILTLHAIWLDTHLLRRLYSHKLSEHVEYTHPLKPRFFGLPIHTHTRTQIYIYIYIYTHFICVFNSSNSVSICILLLVKRLFKKFLLHGTGFSGSVKFRTYTSVFSFYSCSHDFFFLI